MYSVERWSNHQKIFVVQYWNLLIHIRSSLYSMGIFFRLVTFAKLHTFMHNATTINEPKRKTKQNVIWGSGTEFEKNYGLFGLFDTIAVNHQNSTFKSQIPTSTTNEESKWDKEVIHIDSDGWRVFECVASITEWHQQNFHYFVLRKISEEILIDTVLLWHERSFIWLSVEKNYIIIWRTYNRSKLLIKTKRRRKKSIIQWEPFSGSKR